jgi:phosphoribosyl 1,2-cyclic phosphodiesterase
MFQNLDLFSKAIHFAVLGSGSRGNATVVTCGDDAVLLDCGLSAQQTIERLESIGVAPDRVRAIALTHEHSDHVAGARVTSRTLGVPVYMTSACRAQMDDADEIADVRIIQPETPFAVGAITIEPFRVPHDTVDPVGFIAGNGRNRLGLITDLGAVQKGMIRRLRSCRAIILEFNHDPVLVQANPYPDSIKERILGTHGHLSNAQAASLLSALGTGEVRDVVLAHLSEKNNSADRALAAAMAAMTGWTRRSARLHVAAQDEPGPLLRVDDGRRAG